MPRFFIGLGVAEHVRAYLQLFSGGLPGARWVDVENYHITLRFIGDVAPYFHDELHDMLWRLPMPESFNVLIEGLGVFGGKNPRYLYARVTPSPMLNNLHMSLERLITRLGRAPSKRKFMPHITLAKLKSVDPQMLARYLNNQTGFSPITFPVNQFHLYSSKPQTGGGPYIVEQSFLLTAPPISNLRIDCQNTAALKPHIKFKALSMHERGT